MTGADEIQVRYAQQKEPVAAQVQRGAVITFCDNSAYGPSWPLPSEALSHHRHGRAQKSADMRSFFD
jgi:hypothetical protein